MPILCPFSEYGGIYLDLDQIVVSSLDSLLDQSMVIGREVEGKQCGNGFLLAEPGAPFIKLWQQEYKVRGVPNVLFCINGYWHIATVNCLI